MISRDVLERGVEDFAGRSRSWPTLPPSWWHCPLQRGASRSSGLRVTIFSSAGRPPLLVRAEEVSAPLEGSIRTTRMQTSGEGRENRVRPRPFQQRRSTYGEATCTQKEMYNLRQRQHWLAAVDPWTASARLSFQTTAG